MIDAAKAATLFLAALFGGVLTWLLVLPPSCPKEPHPSTSYSAAPASYADAVTRAIPAVVSIYSSRTRTTLEAPAAAGESARGAPPKAPPREISLGSGVIVSPDGYLLTNHHNIKAAEEIRVQLADGRQRAVSVVGTDPEADLALLRLDGPGEPAIPVGSDQKLRVGDVVLAIGNPFGVGQTVTMGIVSGLGRDRLGINTYENFIQIDAAINPGNSGGALVNTRGELVGINSAIYSQSGGSHGIGFAIPIDMALDIMRQLLKHGEVVRGWIGISAHDFPEHSPAPAPGILVSGVLPNGPADMAGIQAGDIITQVDGRPVPQVSNLLKRISISRPGDRIEIELKRKQDSLRIQVTTGERPRGLE